MSFYIAGTGSGVPDKVVTNFDLAEFLDTSDEWIRTRTGIVQRRVMTDETLLDLATTAAKNAMEDAGICGADLDMIICSTLVGDYISPSLSCLIGAGIGAKCGHMYDMNMGCSGFIYALDMADSFFKAGKVKRVLVVCAEAMTRLVDWNDRSTCCLFGDGAGAVVLEAGDALLGMKLTVDGSAEFLNVGGIAGNSPFGHREIEMSCLYMNGQEIYKFAVSSIQHDVKGLIDSLGLTPDDITYYLLHQANMRIMDSARQRLKQSEDKFPHNIERTGNTSSASIPLLLDELNRAGRFKKGDKLLLSAFGSGLTTGACVLEWKK